MPIRHALAALALLGCARDLALPAASGGPRVDAFEPAHGYAGTLVTVRGASLGTSAATVEVTFGGGYAVQPSSLSNDGTTLTALVPDVSATGPVAVSTSVGRGASAGSFTYDGAGHLRFGRVRYDADLRPHVRAAAPVSGGDAVALAAFGAVQRLVRLGDGQLPFGPEGVVAFAPIRNRMALATLDASADAAAAGHVQILSGEPLAAEVTIALPAFADARPPASFAVDESGTRAVAVAPGGTWLVDLTKTPPSVATVATGNRPGGPAVAWLGGARFLLSLDDGLHAVDFAAASPLSAAVAAADDGTPLVGAPLGAAASGLVAVDTADGTLVVLDARAWPPTEVKPTLLAAPNASAASASGLAFSKDGSHVFVAKADEGALLSFDLKSAQAGGDRHAATSLPLEEPRAVSVDDTGLVWVAVRGGIAFVSGETGQLVGRLPVRALPASPALRTAACGKVLELAAQGLDALLRYDPNTLAESRCPTLALGTDQAPQDLAASATGGDLYVLRENDVWRFDATSSTPAEKRALPADTLSSMTRPTLRLATDGSALLWRVRKGGVDYVLASDPRKPLAELDFARALSLPAAFADAGGSNLVAGADAAGGLLALVGVRGVAVRALAAALLGQSTPAFPDVASGGDALDFVGLTPNVLAVKRVPGAGNTTARLRTVALPAGAGVDGPVLPGSTPDNLLTYKLTPDGRHLVWLSGTDQAKNFQMRAFDPATAQVLDESLSIALPHSGGAAGFELFLYPDGAHALVVQGDRDRVLLLE